MRFLSVAIGLVLFASGAAVLADGVSVTVRLAAADALEVSYAMPASCQRLSFLKDGPGGQKIRSRWQALDGCGSAEGDQLTRNPACPAVRFRVPVTSDKVSGYPGSFPVGQAVYAHTTNYAVGAECGPVQYRFAAARIATAGAAFSGETSTSADAPALLFSTKLAPDARSLDYFDPALSAVAVGQIRAVADGTATFLRAQMPKAMFKRPIISAALASEPGGPNIGGSAGEILLLSLFNWPAAPAPEHQRLMNKLVAHEMSHPFQIRDAVDGYPDARLIHEGGAEFLRWSVSLRQGWLTPQQAGAELDDALAACLLAVGERSWRDVPARDIRAGWLEYSCGLPAYVYALAARQGQGTPYARIDDFYAQLRAGTKPDFAQAMECAAASPCEARVLPAILEARGAMPAQWASMLKQTGLAAPRAPSQAQTNSMLVQAVTGLVKDDCEGNSSITTTPDSMLLDALKACKTLRIDVEVVLVEGLPLFGGAQALPAMVAACASRKDVALGLKNGASLRMPCRVPYRITPLFYAADMKKIGARLARE
jgi:hypothetical protein